MTKAEQFQKAVENIVNEYRREYPNAYALYQKGNEQYKTAVANYAAKEEEWNRANDEAHAERNAVRAEMKAEADEQKRAALHEKVKRMLSQWIETQARYAAPRDKAHAEVVHASRFLNLAAYPLAYLQAVYALKIYQAYFVVYDKIEGVPKSGARADVIRDGVKQITGGSGWPTTIKINNAEVSADPYPWHGNATKATTEAELRRAEEGRAKCLKTEAEILDRLQLIEQARQQLETFKDTYEKSLRALLDIMEGMHDKAGTRDFFNSIHVY